MFDNYYVYGPYDNNHRLRLVLVEKITGKTTSISYAKYLMEIHLGRKLKPNETIDHIDGNYRNNKITNLRVLVRSIHCKLDVYRIQPITIKCRLCGKTFTRIKRGNRRGTGYFCSRVCSGKYGKLIQLGEINPIKVKKVIPVRYKIKNLSAFKET
jgi:hypothetical protein